MRPRWSSWQELFTITLALTAGASVKSMTTCSSELLDPISGVTSYRLSNVLYSAGKYYLQPPPGGREPELPEGVTQQLQPVPASVSPQCPKKEKRRVILLDSYTGDWNTYHNMLFFVRQFVSSAIAAWGLEALDLSNGSLFYGFHLDAETLAKDSNLKTYKALDTFFTAHYADIASPDEGCVILSDVLLTPKVHYYAEKLPTQLPADSHSEAEVYDFMRQRYVDKYAGDVPSSHQAQEEVPVSILYLSRRPHEDRRVLNEEALLHSMRAMIGGMRGVELREEDFGALSFPEQLRAAAAADVLIGPHGAGLTHVLFQKPQSVLIELIPQGWADPGYRNLALLGGKTYLFWQQTDADLSVSQDGDRNLGRSSNYYADVDEVLALLRAAVKIASMVGERFWPDCPGYEFLHYRRAMPIKCDQLWVRDEYRKATTPVERMLLELL